MTAKVRILMISVSVSALSWERHEFFLLLSSTKLKVLENSKSQISRLNVCLSAILVHFGFVFIQ